VPMLYIQLLEILFAGLIYQLAFYSCPPNLR